MASQSLDARSRETHPTHQMGGNSARESSMVPDERFGHKENAALGAIDQADAQDLVPEQA